MTPDGKGLRADKGKLRFDLVPGDALTELVAVYTVGAEKYADRNWERGMPWSKCFGPMMRHAWRFWWHGEAFDAETGLHHMAHAAWNALALVSYDLRTIGTDDRAVRQSGQIDDPVEDRMIFPGRVQPEEPLPVIKNPHPEAPTIEEVLPVAETEFPPDRGQGFGGDTGGQW